jgi:hypothetical protein
VTALYTVAAILAGLAFVAFLRLLFDLYVLFTMRRRP